MNRSGLRTDPEKTRAWQRRSQQAAITRSRQPGNPTNRRRDHGTRLDAAWRTEVYGVRGRLCRVTGCGRVADEVDHLIPRRPSTRWELCNGFPLCRAHHRAKTEHRILISWCWLDDDQIRWLADAGHAWWDDDGTVSGPHRRIFAPLPTPTV